MTALDKVVLGVLHDRSLDQVRILDERLVDHKFPPMNLKTHLKIQILS